jgi:hypothetical protein
VATLTDDYLMIVTEQPAVEEASRIPEKRFRTCDYKHSRTVLTSLEFGPGTWGSPLYERPEFG